MCCFLFSSLPNIIFLVIVYWQGDRNLFSDGRPGVTPGDYYMCRVANTVTTRPMGQWICAWYADVRYLHVQSIVTIINPAGRRVIISDRCLYQLLICTSRICRTAALSPLTMCVKHGRFLAFCISIFVKAQSKRIVYDSDSKCLLDLC